MRLFAIVALTLTALTGCATGTPDRVEPVSNFEASPYLGTWYEIARLPNRFEKGLSHVTATYMPRKDGGLNVVNMGYSAEENFWEQAHGKAHFVGDPSKGHLKVSFFGPFYASYIVWELGGRADEGYDYAFVSGPNTDYLWLLSRTPTVKQGVIDLFTAESRERGFDVSKLEFIDQSALPADAPSRPKPSKPYEFGD